MVLAEILPGIEAVEEEKMKIWSISGNRWEDTYLARKQFAYTWEEESMRNSRQIKFEQMYIGSEFGTSLGKWVFAVAAAAIYAMERWEPLVDKRLWCGTHKDELDDGEETKENPFCTTRCSIQQETHVRIAVVFTVYHRRSLTMLWVLFEVREIRFERRPSKTYEWIVVSRALRR
jgi:hypothetical protein